MSIIRRDRDLARFGSCTKNAAMPATYVVVASNVTDSGKLDEYVAKVIPTLSECEVLVVDGEAKTEEGDPRHRVVVLRFPSEESARKWYDSDEYRAIKQLRLDATSDGFLAFAKGLA